MYEILELSGFINPTTLLVPSPINVGILPDVGKSSLSTLTIPLADFI
jgi:hypothetical protein